MRVGPLVVLASALAAPAAGNAAVTDILTVKGDTFFDISGGANAAPVDPAAITFSVSFDPSLGDVFDNTTAITLTSSNLAVGGKLGFDYDSTSDMLTVGGAGLSGIGIAAGTNDVLIVVDDVSTSPSFDTFLYSAAVSPGLFQAAEGSVSGSVRVAEPGGVSLLMGAAALLASLRRRSA